MLNWLRRLMGREGWYAEEDENDRWHTPESAKAYREEASRVHAAELKLQEALAIVQTFKILESDRDDLAGELKRQIYRLEMIPARSRFTRALMARPSWSERLRTAFIGDSYLRLASILGLGFAVSIFANILYEFVHRHGSSLFNWLYLITPAHGAELLSNAGSPRDPLRLFILCVITLGFFAALGILALSNKNDARKIAADMIKTILGVYVGMVTQGFG